MELYNSYLLKRKIEMIYGDKIKYSEINYTVSNIKCRLNLLPLVMPLLPTP